jgi:1,4-alpha-glucan branching enzyme
LQLATGTASHQRRFGSWQGGLWLPECAYALGLERDLADHGVRAFCVDQTAVAGFDHLRPVATAAGPVAMPIDWRTVELVWNDRAGYPAHATYRDYHRRTVHDLKPWNNGGDPYDRRAAEALAREHARDFVKRAVARVAGGGLLCCALDTELLGHWWYEGPVWLAAVLEEAPRAGLPLVTVGHGLERVEPVGPIELAPSSWGAHKDLSTWDSPEVSDFAFGARHAELRTVSAAAMKIEPRAALMRAARELLALQSSDWAFMCTRALAGDYPRRRLATHSSALDAALAALTDSREAASTRLGRMRADDIPNPQLRNLAPDLDLASLTTP